MRQRNDIYILSVFQTDI